MTIEEVAQVFRKEKKTIQNRIGKKTFPCKVYDGCVSIVELANHLETQAVYKPKPVSETAILPTVAVIKGNKKKTGSKVKNPELDELLMFWGGVLREIERLDEQEAYDIIAKVLPDAGNSDGGQQQVL